MALCQQCEASRRLSSVQRRLHIVAGLAHALEQVDAVGEGLDAAEDRQAAKMRLTSHPLNYSEIQAEHILDMTMSRRTLQGRSALRDEQKELQVELRRLQKDRE
jgi:DNA gyrase/topoisomerase IV subunit A